LKPKIILDYTITYTLHVFYCFMCFSIYILDLDYLSTLTLFLRIQIWHHDSTIDFVNIPHLCAELRQVRPSDDGGFHFRCAHMQGSVFNLFILQVRVSFSIYIIGLEDWFVDLVKKEKRKGKEKNKEGGKTLSPKITFRYGAR